MKYEQYLINKFFCNFVCVNHHFKKCPSFYFHQFYKQGNFQPQTMDVNDDKSIRNKDFLSYSSIVAIDQ
jgi:hypothetical protein